MGENQEKITQLSADCSGITDREPQGDQSAFLLAFSLQAGTDCRER